MYIDSKLNQLLDNVGDMSLKRRARRIILGLELTSKDQIIDLGCGDGFYLHLLKKISTSLSLIGFDYDSLVLENAAKNLKTKKIRLLKGDIAKMPFKTNKFRKVIMTEVLEHIENEKKVLSEINRILRPNGILVVTVPNYNFPFLWDPINWILQHFFKIHISGTNFFAGIWARHLRLYKKTDLIRIIKKAGFKIEEVEELTTRCLPFNHYIVNLVARFLYDIKPKNYLASSLNKFKNVKKPLFIKLAFFIVNKLDRLNDILPGKNGVHIFIKARKEYTI